MNPTATLKCVLVGIDYSENCESALLEASRIANWHDAKLVCLHVFDEEIMSDFRRQSNFDEKGVVDSSVRRLELFVSEAVGAGHEIECVVAVGHPFKEILLAVENNKADLLVLGSHGWKNEDSRRTGAFASRCVRKAPVEVLLVRRRQREPFRMIVGCIDFSENSHRAALRAAEIAKQDGAQLELLNVYQVPIVAAGEPGGLAPILPPLDSDEIIKEIQSKLDEFAGEVAEHGGGLEVRTKVIQKIGVSTGIVEHLLEVEADLVVLGTRGRTGFEGLFLGTTAERLIHDSPCSALAVKPEGFDYSVK